MFPRVIVILGAPRSGTTVLKRYLASNPGCVTTPYPKQLNDVAAFDPAGVAVWKRTKWIDPAVLPQAVRTLGESVCYVVLARYPRSAYLSLLELNAFRRMPTHAWLPSSSFNEYLKWWRDAYRTACEVLPKNRHLLVSYESFVSSPVEMRRRILAAVGLVGANDTWYDNAGPLEPTFEDEKCIGRSFVHAESIVRSDFIPEASRAYDALFGEGASDRLKASVSET